MKRRSPTELGISTRTIFDELASPLKLRKMTEAAGEVEDRAEDHWTKTWNALDFDDGSSRVFFYYFPSSLPNAPF